MLAQWTKLQYGQQSISSHIFLDCFHLIWANRSTVKLRQNRTLRFFAEELRNLALGVTVSLACSNICFSSSYKCFHQANCLCAWGCATNPYAVRSTVGIQLSLWQTLLWSSNTSMKSVHCIARSSPAKLHGTESVALPSTVLGMWERDFWN